MATTGFSTKRPPYVVFVRGTPAAFKALEVKDSNTLYYISEKDSKKGTLYLGDKVIASSSGGAVSLSDLSDVLISAGIKEDDVLVYNGAKWQNKNISSLIASLISGFDGATETTSGKAGLVPAPLAGQQNYYLKGDGTWASPQTITKTTSEWNQMTSYVSTLGVIYIYSDYKRESGKNIPGFKVGDGTSYVIDLPFSTSLFDAHVADTDIHVTKEEKDFWNSKVRPEVMSDLLILTDE